MVTVTPVPSASLASMQCWLLSVACVNFDLELGPDVEFMYPPLEISKEEKDNIAFSSFPDTTVFSDGSLVFSWRIREVPLDASAASVPHIPDVTQEPRTPLMRRASRRVSRTMSWRKPKGASAPTLSRTSSTASTAPTSTSRSTSYLYGYTYFRQRKDPTLPRGYFQKSLVILTHLPHVGLFTELIARVGPQFFEHGITVLESFLRDVAAWPVPDAGLTLALPVLGSMLHVSLPHGNEAQNGDGMRPGLQASQPVLGSVPHTSLLDVFYEMMPDLWRMWECTLLAEPILVMGHDPRSASEAVWHLVDLIRPVPCAGEFRPYFHIHDYDFRALVHRPTPPTGALLGATNPFFVQTCAHWPHRIQLGRRHRSVHGRGSAPPPEPGFFSSSKRRVSKDRALLKQWMAWRDDPTQHARATTAVRRYFSDLTERFLAPLHQYMATLIPASFDLSSPAEAPRIKPFHAESFLQWLKQHPGPLKMRQRSLSPAQVLRHSLYADFLQSPNFALWLHHRVAAAQAEQYQRRIAALAAGDVVTFGRTRTEVESIDLFLRLREELRVIDATLEAPPVRGPHARWRSAPDNDATPTSLPMERLPSSDRALRTQRERLAAQMQRLLETMPDDLRLGLEKQA